MSETPRMKRRALLKAVLSAPLCAASTRNVETGADSAAFARDFYSRGMLTPKEVRDREAMNWEAVTEEEHARLSLTHE